MIGANTAHASLLARVAAGEQDAMRQCIDRFGGLVWSLARSFCPNHAEAEDATQDVFLHLWQVAGRYDPTLGTETQFIAVVTRRRLIDWVRRQPDAARVRACIQAASIAQGSTRPRDPQNDNALWHALQQLLPEQQSILLLSICRGLTHEQIATHLSMPVGTVKSTLYRTLHSLRGRLAPADPAVKGGVA